jgi:hypothetical protein
VLKLATMDITGKLEMSGTATTEATGW